jgi:pimeloyl-ACP methyl ester carboxylesterase
LTPGSLRKAERELLSYSGLTEEEVEIRKVPVGDGNKVTTLLVGDPSKPKLVLLHGYGGSAFLFYKVMKGLSEHFHVIMFDIIGMGSSSRPTFNPANNVECDEFFMRIFEAWRLEMDDLTDFYAAAHSYGAYLMGTYAAQYPQHIKKLMLLSPLGVKVRPEGWDLSKTRYRSGRAPPLWSRVARKSLWGRVTPFQIVRLGTESRVRKGLSGYVRFAQPVDSPEESSILQEYLF